MLTVFAVPKPFTAFTRLIDSHFRMTSFKFPFIVKGNELSMVRTEPIKGWDEEEFL